MSNQKLQRFIHKPSVAVATKSGRLRSSHIGSCERSQPSPSCTVTGYLHASSFASTVIRAVWSAVSNTVGGRFREYVAAVLSDRPHDASMQRNHEWAMTSTSGICLAYIGPGAGFAFLGSFLVLFVAILLAFVSVLTFPLRAVAALLFRRKRTGNPQARRVVILGLDGLDPGVATSMMERGGLPTLAALRQNATFSPLKTTCPPISPVAWSS